MNFLAALSPEAAVRIQLYLGRSPLPKLFSNTEGWELYKDPTRPEEGFLLTAVLQGTQTPRGIALLPWDKATHLLWTGRNP